SGGAGGTVTVGANVTGSGIFIDTVTILGAPVNDGVYNVDGTGVCPAGVGGSCGLLSFDRNANTISIVGSIPSLGILAPITLMSGDLSGGFTSGSSPTAAFVTASGVDTKASQLLTAIGLPTNTQFAYMAFQLSANTQATGSPYTAP